MTVTINNQKQTHMKQKYPFVTYSLCKVRNILLFFALFVLNNAFSQTFTDNTPGGAETWVVPAGVTSVNIAIWGGGGSGGGSNTSGNSGSGAGGGGYSFRTIAVTPGDVISYNVGAGGAATSIADGNNGSPTTASHTPTTTSMTANGGGKGLRNSTTFGTGGTATGGTTNTTGANGTAGGSNTGGNGGNGGNAAGTGGAGQSNADGTPGGNPGGGGGGGERGGGQRSGGAGGNGRFEVTYTIPGPANDNCSGAIPLTINTTCSYISGTNAGATASGGVPAPGCASYSGGDVWYSFVVPAGGQVTVDLIDGVVTDSGMAWYTGTCGSLTLLQCDDDSSTNGAMSSITRTGLTPGSTIYVRIWEYSNDNNGTFGICASAPSACTTPTAQPTALVLTPSGGSVTGSFTAPSPVPTNYLVVYNTTNTVPNPANGTTYTVGGTIGAGNIVADIDSNTTFTVTGLASNTTYYFFVFAYNATGCTGGPLYLESPTAGPLTGTTTTGLSYCIPSTTSGSDYISNFTTTSGLNNINYSSTAMNTNGYGDFYTSRAVSNVAGAPIDFSEVYVGGSHGFRIWVDWNKDGDFADAGETVFSSAAIATGHAGTFNIPGAQAVGDYRMRIRAYWNTNVVDPCATGLSYSEALDFKLTVLTPLPCAGTPSNITVSAITGSTATVTWTAAAPAPLSGYQISVSTTNGAPVTTNTTGAGVTTLNLTGLASETTYYVYVRANCGAILGQGYWIGPIIFKTPCAPGSGTGTSSLGCPSVVSGGLGLSGSDPAPITCTTSGCVDLEATYLNLGQTTSYTAQSIPYSPPYQFGCLANAVSVNTDDVWSPLINLPFNFCFYGNNYNQCLIGSNGVLTFDTTGNTAGGSSTWSFSTNVPDTSLFRNTIFGVYHDIDPSEGGTVGWELVTLTSGCRALVASWKDIPMFSSSCNSMLYTGMMVLYENTNIIEVYIKEKNVCASWNSGNAIVGVQNAAGTTGTAAPNRNGLDADWTTATEAWRFVPSGTAITSIKWYQGAGTGGPVVGTTDTINVCPSATTTYTAEVTYTLCSGATLKVTDQTTVTVSGSKVWNGSVSTNWNVANNWTPSGVPNNTHPVVIPNVTNDPIITGGVSALACSITVQSGGVLTINTGNNVTVTNAVSVAAGGQFIVQDDASLIQVNNVANTGNIEYRRVANLRLQDYCYWSSPVANFPVQSVSPLTPSGYIFKWGPTTVNPNGGQGYWIGTTENMVATTGYILRAPSTFTNGSASPLTANFIGVPNNGTFNTTVYRGTDYTTNGTQGIPRTLTDDNWNLIGNPYPSAIGVNEFLDANSFAVPTNDIQGFVKIWTHGLLPANTTDPFYQNYTTNYYPSDYTTVNKTAATSGAGDYKIGGGQGFMVMMDNGAPGTGTVTFNNTMRNASFANTQFYKTEENKANATEKSRIWIDLVAPNGSVNRTVIGYVEGATNERDNLYDAFTDYKPTENFYSLLGEEPMVIQGKKAPFDKKDIVPIGMKIGNSGNCSIAIAIVDGIFSSKKQTIYLEDKKLNKIHELSKEPYAFTAESGIINDRFVLRYTDKTTITEEVTVNDVQIYASTGIHIKSTPIKVKEITIFDVLGKKLLELNNVNKNEIAITEIKPTTDVLLIRVTLDNGEVQTKKLVY